MNKRFRMARVILLIAVLGGLVWVLLSQREPTYQGRSLTAWLNDYAKAHQSTQFPPPSERFRAEAQRASHAIHEIGTNALPTLIRMMQAKDSPLKQWFIKLVGRQSFVRFRFTPAWQFHEKAAYGFFILGEAARPATPELARLLITNPAEWSFGWESRAALSLAHIAPDGAAVLAQLLTNPPSVRTADAVDLRRSAAIALYDLGAMRDDPEATAYERASLELNLQTAVPALLQSLQDPDYNVRETAAITLGRYGLKSDEVLPALVTRLQDSFPEVCCAAADALAKFKGKAEVAVPALLNTLQHQNAQVRERAAKALEEIDPEAAAKAGVRFGHL
jgi:hypothetical protein